MTQPSEPTYLSPDEASAMLQGRGLRGCSVATLANWRKMKEGPSYYQPSGTGGKISYRLSDLEAFIEKSLVDPGQTK